jgi:hypothetical protein
VLSVTYTSWSKEAEDEVRAGDLLRELNECRAEKDRLEEKDKERMEAVLKQCQREMSELKVKQAAFDRCGQGVAQLETQYPFLAGHAKCESKMARRTAHAHYLPTFGAEHE